AWHARRLSSVPTRRSSDLGGDGAHAQQGQEGRLVEIPHSLAVPGQIAPAGLTVILPAQDGGQGEEDQRHPNKMSAPDAAGETLRSEEHTSELQSRFDLVCR